MIEGFYLLIQLWKYRKHQVQCLKRLKVIKGLKRYRYNKPLVVSSQTMSYENACEVADKLLKTPLSTYENIDKMWASLASLLRNHYGYEIEIKDDRRTFIIQTLEGITPFDYKPFHVFGKESSLIDNVKIFSTEHEYCDKIREYCQRKFEERNGKPYL